jgi:hypothetical protein
MSQVTGFPGGGVRITNGFSILVGAGDPSTSTTPDVKGCTDLNSVFFRTDATSAAAWLYRCSTAAVFQNGVLQTAAVWTAK